jgi:hypothetical protein
VVLIMAPLPSVMIDRMKFDGRYRYIDDLRRILSEQYRGSFYDFFDMRDLAPDGEFYDGIHGGEVAYMRIIRVVAADPKSALHGLVDEHYLELEIRLSGGHDRVVGGPIDGKISKVGTQD